MRRLPSAGAALALTATTQPPSPGNAPETPRTSTERLRRAANPGPFVPDCSRRHCASNLRAPERAWTEGGVN